MKRPTASALVLFLGLAISFHPETSLAQTSETAALTVTVARPAQRQWPETVPASGWLKPWHEAVIAAEIGGLRITDVLVDVGSAVSKGQPLARLDDEIARAEVRKEEAALVMAKADLAKAQANADRARKLQGSGALSDEKYTDYQIAERTAIAGVDTARALLDAKKIALAQTTITAVDDGLVSSRTAQLGAVVSSGTELFRLVRQHRVDWQAEVSARYFPRIREGLAATIIGPESRPTKGVVRLVGPTINTDTGRALAYVALTADARLPVGLYVTGQIELETTTALCVPESAVVLRDGVSYLFKVGEDWRVARIRVQTGRRNRGEIEITAGLDPSTKIVTAGGAFLSDGALVRLEGEGR